MTTWAFTSGNLVTGLKSSKGCFPRLVSGQNRERVACSELMKTPKQGIILEGPKLNIIFLLDITFRMYFKKENLSGKIWVFLEVLLLLLMQKVTPKSQFAKAINRWTLRRSSTRLPKVWCLTACWSWHRSDALYKYPKRLAQKHRQNGGTSSEYPKFHKVLHLT